MTNKTIATFALFTFISINACSSNSKKSSEAPAPQTDNTTPTISPMPIAQSDSLFIAKANNHDQHVSTDTPAEKHSETKNHTTTKHAENDHHQAQHEHHRETGPISADTAMGWLKNGNARFLKNNLRNDGQASQDRQRLATGQKPHTIILSCSDSRVPPEVIFDQKLGEIFVIRVAGEALDSSVIASIEYAVSHLGTNLILVMGHDSCGAVKAAHGTLDGGDAGSASLNQLVKDIHPRIAQYKGIPLTPNGNEESWANVRGVAKDLVERSQIVRDLVAGGDVKIAKAVYHLQSGKVEWK